MEAISIIKWCLCVTEERDICTPKFFDTYEEAYQEMKGLLVGSIADSSYADEHLGEDGGISNIKDAEENELVKIFL